MKERKTICLVTNWYPTKENPYQGLFFKEQAFALSDEFDFVIIHCYGKIKQIKQVKVKKDNEEKNTREYSIGIRIPLYILIADKVHDLWVKKVTHKTIKYVGRYISPLHTQYREKAFEKAFKDYMNESVDVLYCVRSQDEAASLHAISKALGKPYVISEHAPFPWPGTLLDDANKEAIEKADLFLAISIDKIRQIKIQNIKLPPIRYVGNMVDEEAFRLIDRHGEDHVKTLIIVAANSYFKNYNMFIAVIKRLCEITNADFRVMIVGYGANKGYSQNVEEFETLIRTSSIADKTELIREVPHSEIGNVMKRADVFVMTSIQEGQPVSAMEAACCGLAVFSTRCGGVEDYVDEKMGRIYGITDIEGMAAGLKDYLEGRLMFDPEYIRKRVVEQFGREAFTNNLKDAFNSVIKT